MWVRRISYEESSSFSVSWFLFLSKMVVQNESSGFS